MNQSLFAIAPYFVCLFVCLQVRWRLWVRLAGTQRGVCGSDEKRDNNQSAVAFVLGQEQTGAASTMPQLRRSLAHHCVDSSKRPALLFCLLIINCIKLSFFTRKRCQCPAQTCNASNMTVQMQSREAKCVWAVNSSLTDAKYCNSSDRPDVGPRPCAVNATHCSPSPLHEWRVVSSGRVNNCFICMFQCALYT